MTGLEKDICDLADALDNAKESLFKILVLIAKIDASKNPCAIELMKRIEMRSLSVFASDLYYGMVDTRDLREEAHARSEEYVSHEKN